MKRAPLLIFSCLWLLLYAAPISSQQVIANDPIWPDRDRFVLSNGHASMLLWSLLYLTGTVAVNAEYERLGRPSVTLDDIRRFRQLGSKAPGHPEYHWVSGVETTSGPLGQGIANRVGMAIARKWLAARYNQPGFDVDALTQYLGAHTPPGVAPGPQDRITFTP